MPDLSPKRLLVLREVGHITGNHPMAGAGDGWLRAFHVRYFRNDSPVKADGLSLDAVSQHLNWLARRGYLDKCPGAQSYRINDKGRQALEDNNHEELTF